MEKRECFPMFLFLHDHPQLLWSIWNIFNNQSEYSVQSVCLGFRFQFHAKLYVLRGTDDATQKAG